MKKGIYITSLIFTLGFSSCHKESLEYSVDGTLDPYLQMFLDEGKKRGFDFNVEENGLIVEFAKLEGNTIGLCTYQSPLLIQIDKNYWEETTDYENQEDLRQNVVFHELAHGLLNRPHDNSLLPNEEWKSIMCGGDEIPGRVWSINFNGYRKEYYLNELFNVKTEAPEWSQPQQFVGEKGTLIAELDLGQSYNGTDAYNNRYLMRNHIYTISSGNSESNIIKLWDGEGIKTDFYFETVMNIYMGEKEGFTGIVGLYDYDKDGVYTPQKRTRLKPVNDGCNYIAIFKNDESDLSYKNSFFLLNSNCFSPIAGYSGSTLFKQDEYNKLAISRHDGELFFYLNDKLLFRNDYQAEEDYIAFGIVLPAGGKVDITSVELYGEDQYLKSGKITNRIDPSEIKAEPLKGMPKSFQMFRK